MNIDPQDWGFFPSPSAGECEQCHTAEADWLDDEEPGDWMLCTPCARKVSIRRRTLALDDVRHNDETAHFRCMD
jgi:hypothetical protein